MSIKYYVCLFFILAGITFFSGTVEGQQTIPVNYLSIENGLSNNNVTSCYRDGEGFMWFGTFDGLNCFDGYEFKVFRNRIMDSASLVNNHITAINEDADKKIWVGTKKGVSIFDRAHFKFYSLYYREKGPKAVVKNCRAINDIKPMKGNMLVATAGEGLILVKKGQKYGSRIPYRVGNALQYDYHAMSVDFDGNNRAWVFIQGAGLCILDEKTAEIRQINGQVTYGSCIRYDNKGGIWISTFSGLYYYDFKNKKVIRAIDLGIKLSNEKITALCYDKEQRLWIATDGGGINILDENTTAVTYMQPSGFLLEKTLNSSAIYALYRDNDARMWIGTLRGGINIIDRQKYKFATIAHNPVDPNSLIDNFVLSFCEDLSGSLWIGTDGGGLSRWNRRFNTFTNFKAIPDNASSLSGNFVTSLLCDAGGAIWIGTYGGGICRYNPGDNTFKRYICPDSKGNPVVYVWKLYEDREKNLYVGTVENGYMFKYNMLADRFEVYDRNLINVLTLYEDKEKTLWLGTFDELIKISRGGKRVHYKIGNAVRSIHEDAKGHFWVGIEGGGLLRFDRNTGRMHAFTTADGLPNNSVLNILEDKAGHLWLSTFHGLSRFDPANGQFQNYSESDGLQSNQLNYNSAFIDHKGAFLIGGLKGFNIFNPDSIPSETDMPVLRITSIKVDNAPLEASPELKTNNHDYDLVLPYNKATLSVDFAALEYSSPDKIAYAIYLEGQDKKWNYIGKLRNANYTHLSEGSYTLHIKSTNSEGQWNKAGTIALRIKILPPWFRSWWAYLSYAGFLVFCIYIYLKYKNKQQNLQFDIKLANLNAEKEKEINEKKFHFFTAISHEFRTPLTLIINPIKDMISGGGDDTEGNKDQLNIVYRNAKRLLSLADQLLLFRKADNKTDRLHITRVDIIALCGEVYLCFMQLAERKKVQYTFTPALKIMEVNIDKEKIETVLFNLLSNALKYTPEGGMVNLSLSIDGILIRIAVMDSGPGIPEEEKENIFHKFYQVHKQDASTGFGIGLYIAQDFAGQHGGKITYSNLNGQGTIFTLSLPYADTKEHLAKEIPKNPDKTGLLTELSEDDGPHAFSSRPEASALTDLPDQDLIVSKPSILVVDDDDELRAYIVSLFRQDYVLYEAPDGNAGLAAAKHQLPDIVISDILMNEGSGIELCQSLKQDPALRHIPIILLTASMDTSTELAGIELGADDYITKPFDKELLKARVQNLLQKRSDLQQYFFNEITLQENKLKIPEKYKDFLEKCISLVEQNIDNDQLSVKMLAKGMSMSHSALYKKVKIISGHSINAFIRFIRLRKAAELLIHSSCNINEAAFQVGITDVKYFRREFYKLFGMNPSEYIHKYRKPFSKNYKLNEKIVK